MEIIVKHNNMIGSIAFGFDDGNIWVSGIEATHKRLGIGTELIRKLEQFASEQQGVEYIEVPSSPTKEALSFWLSLGYEYVSQNDRDLGKEVIESEETGYMGEPKYFGDELILLRKGIKRIMREQEEIRRITPSRKQSPYAGDPGHRERPGYPYDPEEYYKPYSTYGLPFRVKSPATIILEKAIAKEEREKEAKEKIRNKIKKNPRVGVYSYIGNCVDNPFKSTAELSNVIDSAKEISRCRFLENVDMSDAEDVVGMMKEYPNDFMFYYNTKRDIYFYENSMIEYFYK